MDRVAQSYSAGRSALTASEMQQMMARGKSCRVREVKGKLSSPRGRARVPERSSVVKDRSFSGRAVGVFAELPSAKPRT